MSEWTHNCCKQCWEERNSNRKPVSIVNAKEEKCCFCGKKNTDGIYVREDPTKTQCKGIH